MPTSASATWLTLTGPGARSEDVVSTVRAALAELPASSITVFDRDMRHLLVRGEILRTGGVDPEELEGGLAPDVLDPRVWAFYRPLYEAALRGERIGSAISSADGLRHYKIRVGPVRSESGEVVGGVVIATDITDERAAHAALTERERALEASEALFRLAMDASAIGTFLGSLDGHYTWVNPAFCRMLGYSADELVGRTITDVTHPDDAAQSLDLLTEITDDPEVVSRQRKRYLSSSGGTVWADVTVVTVRDSAGAAVRVIGQAVDVTAEVANFEALQRSARDFQMLAENATDVVYRNTIDGIFEWVSPSMATVLGWEPATLIGTPSTAIMVAEDRELVYRRRAELLAGTNGAPLLIRFNTSWGGIRVMSGTTHPVMSEDGSRVVGNIVGLRDVTEEQRIRRELAHRASHDSLTGVSNRDDLMSRLRRRLELPPQRSGSVGVLFCDVDNLKAVNDAHGHPAGDAVLTTVAERLLAAVRSNDIVARLGGDEFVVVVNDVEDVERLGQVAEKCRSAVSAPIEHDGHLLDVSVSVGAVLATPSEDADDVLTRADRAVYRAKSAGRDRTSVEGHG